MIDFDQLVKSSPKEITYTSHEYGIPDNAIFEVIQYMKNYDFVTGYEEVHKNIPPDYDKFHGRSETYERGRLLATITNLPLFIQPHYINPAVLKIYIQSRKDKSLI